MAAHAGVDLDAAVAQVLDSLVEISGVCRAGLALSEGAGRRLRFTSSDRGVVVAPGQLPALDWCHIDAYDDVPLTAVVRTGDSVVGGLEDLDQRYVAFAEAQRAQGVAAVAVLPLMHGEAVWGGIVLFYDESQRFGPHQLAVLQSVAARATEQVGSAREVVMGVAPTYACDCDGEQTACVEVDPVPVSVALARRFARRQLHDWKMDDDVLDAAVLCLSELVTNVVMHASSRSRIQLRQEPDRLVITVRDGGRGSQARASSLDPDPLLVHGRGLQLVEALSLDWGTDTDADGTTVWCSFATGRSLT
jgi:anti-sigma regulatory factor (Ser/Thr protein kinase)